MVCFGMHRFVCSNELIRSALISPSDASLWYDKLPYKKVPYFVPSNTSGGHCSSEDDENNSVDRAQDKRGTCLACPCLKSLPWRATTQQARPPALTTPWPSCHICSWPLQQGASASLEMTERTLSSLHPALSLPTLVILPPFLLFCEWSK